MGAEVLYLRLGFNRECSMSTKYNYQDSLRETIMVQFLQNGNICNIDMTELYLTSLHMYLWLMSS